MPVRAQRFLERVAFCTVLCISDSLCKESGFRFSPHADVRVELRSFYPGHTRQSRRPQAAKLVRVERLRVLCPMTKGTVSRNSKWPCRSQHFGERDAFESMRVKFVCIRYLQCFLGKMKHFHFLFLLLTFSLWLAMQGLFLPSHFLNFRTFSLSICLTTLVCFTLFLPVFSFL